VGAEGREGRLEDKGEKEEECKVPYKALAADSASDSDVGLTRGSCPCPV
jgi:hypothetical protein